MIMQADMVKKRQIGSVPNRGNLNISLALQLILVELLNFANTDQGLWLAENAHRFRFTMSYPEKMEHVAGYIFYPWHYRFIGIEEALEWKRSGMTLKEYLEIQPQDYVKELNMDK